MQVCKVFLLVAVAGAMTLCGMVEAAAPLTTVRVASGLERPTWVTHAPGDEERVFVIEKRGRIRVVENGTLLATPFLDIDAIVGGGTTNNSEQGLLGLAFHPDYADNGRFYVYYTDNSGDSVVARYLVSADPNAADAGSAVTVLTIAQPQSNHNAGWIAFGPDGYLYIASGDGGGGGDDDAGHTPGVGNGQDITDNLLGKILRIDASVPGEGYNIPADNPFVGEIGDDEIWAFGLRNPWRPSFDGVTGDLWIADVGQESWEEVNFQPAESGGGENYGWRCREGMHDFDTSGDCGLTPFAEPIHEYSHTIGCSVTGGYVYRGCAIPDLRGAYFFADYCSARIWSLRYDGNAVFDFQDRTADLAPGGGLDIQQITSFGEDAAGELYVCDQIDGEVFKIVPEGPSPLLGDFDGDGSVDLADYEASGVCLLGPGTVYQAAGCGAFDFDCDADVDLRDMAGFQAAFGS